MNSQMEMGSIAEDVFKLEVYPNAIVKLANPKVCLGLSMKFVLPPTRRHHIDPGASFPAVQPVYRSESDISPAMDFQSGLIPNILKLYLKKGDV